MLRSSDGMEIIAHTKLLIPDIEQMIVKNTGQRYRCPVNIAFVMILGFPSIVIVDRIFCCVALMPKFELLLIVAYPSHDAQDDRTKMTKTDVGGYTIPWQ